MPRTKRQYTEDDKAVALAFLDSNNGNLDRTAKTTGIPRNTLRRWKLGEGVTEPVSNLRHQKRDTLLSLWEGQAQAALEDANVARDEANYAQLMMGAGLATDKILALKKFDAVTPERLESVFTELDTALDTYVTDPHARQKIADELKRIAGNVRGAAGNQT